MKTILIAMVLLSNINVFAADEEKAEGPCKQIKEACEKAGFAPKQAKEGTGLWVDCIGPIMQGKEQPKKAKMALPTVDASIVAACKAKRPNFGEGHGKKEKK